MDEYAEMHDAYRHWGVADLRAARDEIDHELERLDALMEEAMREHEKLEMWEGAVGLHIEDQQETHRRTFLSAWERAETLRSCKRHIGWMLNHKIVQPHVPVESWRDMSEAEQAEYCTPNDVYRPYSDESAFDEPPISRNGKSMWNANAKWNRYLRYIINRYYEIYPAKANSQAKAAMKIAPLLSEQFKFDASSFGQDQLRRVIGVHRTWESELKDLGS